MNTSEHIQAALFQMVKRRRRLNAAYGTARDASIEVEIVMIEQAVDEQRRLLTRLASAADTLAQAAERQAEQYYSNRYGRIPRQPDTFWRELITATCNLYNIHPRPAWYIYGALHRPMSASWARIDGVWYYHALHEFCVPGVHTWLVSNRALTADEIDRYELTSAAEVSWE